VTLIFTSVNPHTSKVIDLSNIKYCGCKIKFKIIAIDKNCTKESSQVSVQLKSFTGSGVKEVF